MESVCVFVWRKYIHVLVHPIRSSPARSSLVCECECGCGWACWEGGGGLINVHDGYECNGKNCMLGVIPTGRIFMSSALCITVYIHTTCM